MIDQFIKESEEELKDNYMEFSSNGVYISYSSLTGKYLNIDIDDFFSQKLKQAYDLGRKETTKAEGATIDELFESIKNAPEEVREEAKRRWEEEND